MTQQFPVPSDIVDVSSMLRVLISDLSDIMACDVREWFDELREDIQGWKAGGKEPDWVSYRSWMNEICFDDGMPALFVEV